MSYRVVVSLVASNCRCHCRQRYDTRAKKKKKKKKGGNVCLFGVVGKATQQEHGVCLSRRYMPSTKKALRSPPKKSQSSPFSLFHGSLLRTTMPDCLILVSSFIIIHHHHTTTVAATAAAWPRVMSNVAKGTVQRGQGYCPTWMAFRIKSNRIESLPNKRLLCRKQNERTNA
jgi:hypothetical protein